MGNRRVNLDDDVINDEESPLGVRKRRNLPGIWRRK
jgi:hypothetical protein